MHSAAAGRSRLAPAEPLPLAPPPRRSGASRAPSASSAPNSPSPASAGVGSRVIGPAGLATADPKPPSSSMPFISLSVPARLKSDAAGIERSHPMGSASGWAPPFRGFCGQRKVTGAARECGPLHSQPLQQPAATVARSHSGTATRLVPTPDQQICGCTHFWGVRAGEHGCPRAPGKTERARRGRQASEGKGRAPCSSCLELPYSRAPASFCQRPTLGNGSRGLRRRPDTR